MTRPRRFTGLQFEIIANLLVVVIAGLTVVAVVMGTLASRSVEYSALRELRMGAHTLERVLVRESPRLGDLAALIRSMSPRMLGGHWAVLNQRGRELGRSPELMLPSGRLLAWAREAERTGSFVRGEGLPSGSLVLVVPVTGSGGEVGTLVGYVSNRELTGRLWPLLRSGAGVLLIAAGVFVAFGAYLLRRRIVLPLQELSRAAQHIAEGDLSVETRASGSDELATLASQFNEMARSLAREREALDEAYRSLARSERLAAVGQLSAGVAHEVGNPVAAILGYTDVALRDGELGARSRRSLESIREEALRIRGLVRELLDLGRPPALDPHPVHPNELLEGLADRLRFQSLLAGIELRVDVEPALPELVVDRPRVEQVLVNLVENAAHAVRTLSDPRVELRARRVSGPVRPGRRRDDGWTLAGRAVALSVLDNGPGIDPEDQPRLFDPFFTTKEPGQGTGLGLWNCHRMAELCGGRIELESAAGRTCFSLILPVADTQDRDVQTPRPDHR
ncbi:MAG: ATP-binding protein [Myxococcota bacterium]